MRTPVPSIHEYRLQDLWVFKFVRLDDEDVVLSSLGPPTTSWLSMPKLLILFIVSPVHIVFWDGPIHELCCPFFSGLHPPGLVLPRTLLRLRCVQSYLASLSGIRDSEGFSLSCHWFLQLHGFRCCGVSTILIWSPCTWKHRRLQRSSSKIRKLLQQQRFDCKLTTKLSYWADHELWLPCHNMPWLFHCSKRSAHTPCTQGLILTGATIHLAGRQSSFTYLSWSNYPLAALL